MRGLWGTSALALALGVMAGGEAQAQDPGVQLAQADPDITVTATRTPQESFDVPVTVTVIDAEEIERNLATDIKDLVRFEPGVTVPTSPSRFTAALASTGRDGNSGFNIRGLGGNRVLFQLDGIRVPDGFSFGPAAFGRGDYVDLDLLQSVEILRGPGSALYGSDGMAGVVSFITKDPTDFLADDEAFGVRLRGAYASADDSFASGVTLAGLLGEDWSAILAYTRREGHEQENMGEIDTPDTRRTTPNPQDLESDAAMVRVVFEPNDMHRVRLTADYGERNITTEALSARAVLPPDGPPLGSTSVLDLDGVDEGERNRLAFDYTFTNEGAIDRAFVAVYAQDSSLYQFSDEDRNTAVDRTRITTFDNEVWGISSQLESDFSTGSVEHTLIYGFDYSVTTQEGVRGGTVPPVGETFPTRAFPVTEYTQTGVFIQDQIDFMDGRVSLFPALRYDSYELDPSNDALYTLPIEGQSDSRITPRFGAVVWPTETFGVFFNFAEGFKAPSPSQVNNGFANPVIGYTSIPNPDLGPETSEALELGVRWRDVTVFGGDLRASANVFGSWYDDFIEQVQISGSFTPLDPAVFQYVNLSSADIWGAESRVNIAWDNGFGAQTAISFAEGTFVDGAGATVPLESIEPWRIVAGIGYNSPNGVWGGEFLVTHSSKKDERDTGAPFIPDGFTIFDATAYMHIGENAALRVGVFNITDEKYWWWNDVRGVSTTVDAYTQPGRNFSASISYRF